MTLSLRWIDADNFVEQEENRLRYRPARFNNRRASKHKERYNLHFDSIKEK